MLVWYYRILHTGAKGGSDLNWDPIDMFCSYLKKSNSKTSNATDGMDWFEVDIGLKQAFFGVFERRG
ncbi:unnamed protein product [Brassica oleracea var. botrytis]